MDTLLHDARFGFRVLARNKTFSIAAVLSLALGIGAVTAIFSIVYGVLLKPLPYPAPDRIVQVWQINEFTRRGQTSDPNFEDWRTSARSFQAMAQYSTGMASVTGGSETTRASVAYGSRDFFRAIGVSPVLGRTFSEEDLKLGGSPAVIVSHAFWTRFLGSGRDLDNLVLTFDARAHQVVGVMPEGFSFPDGTTDLWAPREQWPRLPSRTAHNWLVVGRLADGVGLAQARAEMTALAKQMKRAHGDDIALDDVALVPLQEQIVGNVRPALLVLMGAVGFLLLVACANVANLMLAQLNARRRELAVRSAIGASGRRLRRQLFTESVLLAGTGGILGWLLAPWTVRAFLALDPDRLPLRDRVAIDVRVALFSFVIIAGVAIVLALATGQRFGGRDVGEALKTGGRQQSGGRGDERFRGALVAVQVALSLVLLIGAGLLGRTLYRLVMVDPGYRTSHALVVNVALPSMNDPAAWRRNAQFHEQLIDRIRQLPGVQQVGGIQVFPLPGGLANGTFLEMYPGERVETLEDFVRLAKDPARAGQAEFRVASEGYFAAMGIPLRRGRMFDDRDAPDAPHVALVSELLAGKRWPNQDPIGKVIQFGNMDGDTRAFTVIGVVGDVRDRGLDREPRATFYGYYRQRPRAIADFTFVVAGANHASFAPAVQHAIREMRPDVAPHVSTIEDLVATSMADRRFNLWLIAAFGAGAIVLAGLGIYGVTAFWVSRRTQEIGLRLTLGATPGEVIGMVLWRAGRLVAIGALMGAAGALALTRVLRTLLFDVEPTDPATFAAGAGLLVLVAMIACVAPARRAGTVDPAEALRQE
jgi:predicted permease